MATAAGIETVIGSGFEPGTLHRAPPRASAVGTRCPPRSLGISSFKLWLRYAKPSHGRLDVDGGAARALREGGTSLLPVGDHRGGGRLRRRRRGRGVRRRRAHRQGHLQLLGRRAAAACAGLKSAAGARGAAAGDGGSRAPRLLRARLSRPFRYGRRDPVRRRHLPRRGRPRRGCWRRSTPPPRTPRCTRIADALVARTPEILEANARDLEAGREAGLSEALMDRLTLDDERVAGIAAGARAGRRRCPTRSARCSTAAGSPTGSTCAACASRSASSPSSTSRGRT